MNSNPTNTVPSPDAAKLPDESDEPNGSNAIASAAPDSAIVDSATVDSAVVDSDNPTDDEPEVAAEVAAAEVAAAMDAKDAKDGTPTEVRASLSTDERRISLTARGGAVEDAARVIFHVWQPGLGQQSLIRHEAVRLADGSWSATAFVATNDYHGQGVPYNCQVADAVHRLYNSYTGQHLFTASTDEADGLSKAGWNYEGISWVRPGATAGTGVGRPVYRLYNPYSGDHFLTLDRTEYDSLPASGWRQEGVAFDSAAAPTGDDASGSLSESVTVYRLFNPYLSVGSHHFTTSLNEYETLRANGWQGEGVAFYGAGLSPDGAWSSVSQGRHHDIWGDYRVEAHVIPFAEDPEATDPDAADRNATDPEPTAPDATDPGTTDSDSVGSGDEGTDTSDDAIDEAKPPTYADGTDTDSESSGPVDLADASAAGVDGVDGDVRASGRPDPKPDPSGEFVAGTAGFSVSRPTASAHVANVVNAKGTFDVIVDGLSSPSGIASVQVPTWTVRNGQDDLVWYWAARQDDGSYRASVNVGRHTFDHDFTCHVYLTSGNGLVVNAVQLDQHLSLANFITHSDGPQRYVVSIYNPGAVGRVQMGAWSDEGGKDDIAWYDARDEGNGWWSTTVESSRLSHAGTVYVDVFADGEFRGATRLTVQPWEILAWPYRNMYNRVYDLSSPSRWLLAVDTTNCFVGVFEGGRGNWQNRAWWPCAPGAAATPTVKGVFSIGYRGYVFGDGFSCYYYTQFYGGYWFHSIQYYPGTFDVMDGTLGRPKSHGCVRLALENARWINQNIPSGTTVLTY